MERVAIKIYGRVQGVLYRKYALRVAKELGLTGWVKNEKDGTVFVVIEGADDKIKEFTAWCRTGSPLSRVEKVDIIREKYSGEFNEFKII